MAASKKKVVYKFQIFEKRLALYVVYVKSKKNTALLFIEITILFRDSLIGKLYVL